ncbi:MAG: P-II family nitrogen regulator [Bacilli bacterium]|jgi:nitrogen regulatory protein PII|nr:P-II family nitrogen regulator [Bacilli bacterium]MDD3069022.1 P-II family nitrogen regulator [Bacilli bacterium]MDD3841378.1 P-II family nitrogen regulator [Bacilli bacterium]
MDKYQNMKALLIIVNAGFADQAVEVAQNCGATGATILSARGSGAKYSSFLGIHYEPEREIIISVVSQDVAKNIIDAIDNSLGKNTPMNGICFTMPVDHMTSLKKE